MLDFTYLPTCIAIQTPDMAAPPDTATRPFTFSEYESKTTPDAMPPPPLEGGNGPLINSMRTTTGRERKINTNANINKRAKTG